MDYRALPTSLLATLCFGLREDSRIQLRLSGVKAKMNLALLASAVDHLANLVWLHTKDGEKGRNRPKSILNILLGGVQEQAVQSFDTAEEFEAARAKILEG
ncbi:MAG: DUF5361 domain-containing protein [Ruthenibacterium sp.]